MTWVIIALISLLTGVGTVEYQKARMDPPSFQSHTDAPVFDGHIKITPTDKGEV